MLERFLSVFDLTRAFDLLERLSQHTHSWALSGGLAIEIHVLRAGLTPRKRSLNDLDFIATGFADIPRTLAKNFLFRHVHPEEVPAVSWCSSWIWRPSCESTFFEPPAR